MILGDLLLDRCIDADELRAAFAQILAVEGSCVALVPSMAEAQPLSGVTLDVADIGGNFPMQISIYMRDPPAKTLTEIAAKVAARLGARVLIPSDSPDPYVMLLLAPTSTVEEVNLDITALDELGQYKLAR